MCRDPKLYMTDFNQLEDLKEHSKFFLPTTNSALSRNLTHEIWEEYNEVQDALNSCQEDFDRERNDMFDTIYELTN